MPIRGQSAMRSGDDFTCRVLVLLLLLPASLLLLIGPLKAQTSPDSHNERLIGISIGLIPVTIKDKNRKRLTTYSIQVVFPGSDASQFVIIADYCPWRRSASGGQTSGIMPGPVLKVSSFTFSLGGLIPVMRTPTATFETGFFLGVMNKRERLVYYGTISAPQPASPLDTTGHTGWLVTSDIGFRIRSTPRSGPAIALEFTRLEILTRWDLDDDPGHLSFRPDFRFRLTLFYPLPSKR